MATTLGDVLKLLGLSEEPLQNASHNCPHKRQKEKGFITSDLPVVEVCLTGIKFPNTPRFCFQRTGFLWTFKAAATEKPQNRK